MKPDFPTRHPSLRLQDYDYTEVGAYFVTICTWNRRHVFGHIEQGVMVLNVIGALVRAEWLNLPKLRNHVELDQFNVMPNHFHAILFINDRIKGTASRAPTKQIFGQPVSGSLSTIIGGFKSGVVKRVNRLANCLNARIWQRSFFDHVIRNDESLARIREYIVTNPLRWELDRENPQRQGEDDFDRWLSQL